MNKSQQRTESDALECYWKVVGMVRQLEANGLTAAAGAWQKAADLLEKAVEPEIKRQEEQRNAKIAYHQRQMPAQVLAQTESFDRQRALEQENEALKAKLAAKK